MIELDLTTSQAAIFNYKSVFYLIEIVLEVFELIGYAKTSNTFLELAKYQNIESQCDDIEETGQYIIREFVSSLNLDTVSDKRVVLILTFLYYKIFEKDIKGQNGGKNTDKSDCNDLFEDCPSIKDNYTKLIKSIKDEDMLSQQVSLKVY